MINHSNQLCCGICAGYSVSSMMYVAVLDFVMATVVVTSIAVAAVVSAHKQSQIVSPSTVDCRHLVKQ